MPVTSAQQDLNLQKLYILGTGSAANSTEMASFNSMVSASGGSVSIANAVNQYINSLVATQGVVSTIQAIAKNGFGVTLTNAEAQQTISDLTGAGIDSGYKLLDYLSTLDGNYGGTLNNRAEAASSFLDTLSASDKSANFTGAAVTTAVRNMLQNIDGTSASLANANSGFNALSANLSATGITGTVDHFLSGSIVFADTNNDGMVSPGEWTSLTASNGTFVLPNSVTAKNVIVYGGNDLMTGNAFQGQLSSSAGATVVNPFTTLIQSMVNSGQAGTVLDATNAIKSAFSLPATINLMSYNPLTVLANGSATAAEKSAALKVQAASQQISTVIIHAANVADIVSPGATLQSAAAAVTVALAKAVTDASHSTGGTINLADSATVGLIIQAAFTATGATTTSVQIGQIAQVTAASNAAATSSSNITQLAQAADVAQGVATNALIAGANSGSFVSATNSSTGNALANEIYSVSVGSIVPGVPLPATASQNAASAAAAEASAQASASSASAAALKAPTGVALTSVGGTVVTNTLNSSNTNLTAVATIIAGQATGGRAELKIGTVTIANDSTVLSTDTSVTFNLSTANNAALQTAVAAGGVATVTLFDKYGNSAVSTLANPTLAVDYLGALTSLTTANDNFLGTGGNDTFSGTYGNGAGPYTFNTGDILDAGAGTGDTLNITTGAEASTPPDGLWAGISNFEKVFFNSQGNGAQVITTGANFQTAFGANGVELTAQTLLGAIDINLSTFTGTATIKTTTTGAGAHTILTGSGVSTVDATGISAGAQTINGVGLQSVNATINGAGDQVIGTTTGGNLVTVNATILAAGSQTIKSTSNSNVTIVANAASGAQTITTAGGNDKITTTGATGQSATIVSGAGDDVIIAGLGNDLITAGTGADTMTGGGGVDRFEFGTDGSVLGTSLDIITDFNKAGADILSFGAGTSVLLTADITTLVAGVNVNTSAGGMISFHASDDTYAKKVIALQADLQLDAAGSVAMFVDGGNTYVYYAGTAIGNADDQLIQLSGITTLTTMIGGATLSIS